MSRTTVELDHDLVELAKKELGTTNVKETLDTALRLVVQRAARERLAELIDEGLTEQGVDDVDEWRDSLWRRKDTA